MKLPAFSASLATLAAGLTVAAPITAGEYQVDRAADNKVVFVSDAPLDDFEGTTGKIDGYVLFDGDALSPDLDLDSSEVYFEVDLGSLDTGIGLRNRHMCENYLETEQYPYATFKGKLVSIDSCGADSCTVRSSGTMSIHGVDKPVEIVCTVVPLKDGYRVASDFTVRLPDYEIEVPSLMFMKINEEIALHLDFALKKIEAVSAR